VADHGVRSISIIDSTAQEGGKKSYTTQSCATWWVDLIQHRPSQKQISKQSRPCSFSVPDHNMVSDV
jgi:hypothetical protein